MGSDGVFGDKRAAFDLPPFVIRTVDSACVRSAVPCSVLSVPFETDRRLSVFKVLRLNPDGKIDDAPRRNIERLSTEPVFLAVARPFKTRIPRMRVAGVDGEILRRTAPFLRRAVSARRFEGVVLNDKFLGARREAGE